MVDRDRSSLRMWLKTGQSHLTVIVHPVCVHVTGTNGTVEFYVEGHRGSHLLYFLDAFGKPVHSTKWRETREKSATGTKI